MKSISIMDDVLTLFNVCLWLAYASVLLRMSRDRGASRADSAAARLMCLVAMVIALWNIARIF